MKVDETSISGCQQHKSDVNWSAANFKTAQSYSYT